jgi:hypothetical protein
MPTITLQVNPFLDSRAAEDVMTSLLSLIKFEVTEKTA